MVAPGNGEADRMASEDVTVMVNTANDFCGVGAQESCTWIVAVKLPEAVGVPLSKPALESVMPAGKAPEMTLQVFAPVPPEDVNWKLYAVPWVAAGRAVIAL